MSAHDLQAELQPMMVRDWMHADPLTIGGDTLVSEAKRLLSENNLHALPVVDGPRLRGLVTRANLLRMGHFVLHTQNPDEFNFFVTRLKVKDIMVRNPATVQAGDTMEHCLLLGRQLGVAQFPVLDGDTLVGVISANEIFQLAAHCLGGGHQHGGDSPASPRLAPGDYAGPTPASNAVAVQSLRSVSYALAPMDGRDPETEVVLRFSTRNTAAVLRALETAGFPVVRAEMPLPPLMA
jgi:acetoin utilization protein AcuB